MEINTFDDRFLWVTKTVTIAGTGSSASFFHDFHMEKLPEDHNELNGLSFLPVINDKMSPSADSGLGSSLTSEGMNVSSNPH